MSSDQIFFIAIAGVLILGALGAFAVAYRRSLSEQDLWEGGVSSETRKADKAAEVAITSTVIEAPPAEVEALVEGAPEEGAVAVATAPIQVETRQVIEISPEDAGVNRRQFFNRALGGLFGAWMGMFGLASLAMLWPKVSGGFGSDVDAGAVDEIRDLVFNPDGTITPLFVPEAKAYIVPLSSEAQSGSQFGEDLKVVAGGFTALWQKCVHLGCRVPWCGSSQGFECPCHGSKYNSIGEYVAGPAPRNLDRFEVFVRDNRLIVKTGSVIGTSRAPVKSVLYPQGPSCIG